jgi:hypothetical protein
LGLRVLAAAAALCAASAGCGGEDEIDVEAASVLARVPRGSAFADAPRAMRALGYACTTGSAPLHLSCEREERFLLACIKRTRTLVLHSDGRVLNVLVNIGRFC